MDPESHKPKSTAMSTKQLPSAPMKNGESSHDEWAINIPEYPASRVFLIWEKLRFFFNTAMLLSYFYAVIPLHEQRGPVVVIREEACWVLVFWNVLFCLGPVFEGYCALIRIPRIVARVVAFPM